MRASGFENINVHLKEESKDFIKEWMKDAEKYVISANITATKPRVAGSAERDAALEQAMHKLEETKPAAGG